MAVQESNIIIGDNSVTNASEDKIVPKYFVKAKKISIFTNDTYIGNLDNIDESRIEGWLVDTKNPNSRCNIVITLGGSTIHYATTDIPREDVCEYLNIKGLRPGFCLNLGDDEVRIQIINIIKGILKNSIKLNNSLDIDIARVISLKIFLDSTSKRDRFI